MKLLYVEDDRINAMLFEAAMHLQPGIELQVADDAAQALELARRWQPEILVIDAHLPDMSGFDLLQALRTLPGQLRTPAFMCSADDLPEDLARAREAGFYGYWTKPINIHHIMEDLDGLGGFGTSPRPSN